VKPSILIVSDELTRASFAPTFFGAYDLTFAANLDTVLKTLKKQRFDICFIQLRRFQRPHLALLRRLLRTGSDLDLLAAAEWDQVEKLVEALGEKGNCLTRPYYPRQLKGQFDRIIAKRALEKENRFWRVELAALFADKPSLTREDIPLDLWEKAKEGRTKEDGASFKRSRKEFEKQCLRQALERVHGNQTQAAKALGIHRNTLIWKLKKLHLAADSTQNTRKRP